MKTYAKIGLINHVELWGVEAGPIDGPLVILLHGFPDFWWGWRHQIEHLANQGFHVVVPDQRGYNFSSKLQRLDDYSLENLSTDVLGLADHFHAPQFRLVGHDWGGVIAWWLAARYPDRIRQLAILNAPNPDVFVRYVRLHPTQSFKSTYAAFFQLPWIPEATLKAKRFALLRGSLTQTSRPGIFTEAELQPYIEAWSQPGSLTAMLNYYRALGRRKWGPIPRIKPPTLLVWGLKDAFLEPGLAMASLKPCDQFQSLFLHQAGHWVQLEEAETVNEALSRFFATS